MTHIIRIILLIFVIFTLGYSEPQGDVEERPLTQLDVELVQRASAPAISVEGEGGVSCLLTQRFIPHDNSECTWREQRICTLQPSIRSIPIFPSECGEPDSQGLRLSNCKEVVRTTPTEGSKRVCSKKSKEKCPQPCPDCPATHTGDFATHCRKKVQTVCSSVPKIKTGIKLEGDRRFEKQYMELEEECRTTVVGQQCAPINCKFLDLGEDCVVNTKTIDITLTDRVCNICKPRVAEQVSLKEVCKQGSTKRCEDAPIEQLWKKFCTTKTTSTKRKENSVELTLVNILDPVDDLFDQKLNINDGTRTINDSKDNFREPKSNIDSSIKFKFTSSIEEKAAVKKKLHDLEQLEILPARRRPQASVYFNQNDQYIPVLNSRSENKQEINAESTILEKFIEEELQISSHTTENYISASNITLSGSLSVDAFNTTTSIINIPKETTTVSSTSTKQPSNTEEKTTSLYSSHNPDVATENSIYGKDKKNSTSEDQINVSKQMINTVVNYSDNEIEDEKNMITKEDFLKSCFLFGIGCDFNPKNIDDSLLQKTTTTESTVHLLKYEPYMESHDHEQQLLSQLDCLFKHNCPPKDQIYPSTLSTSTKPPKKATLQFEASTEGNQNNLEQHKEEYKDSVSRLKCLFNGSCDSSGVKRRRPTTTTTPAGPTLSQRERRLEEEIRSRATNCFLRGIC